jgi:uncharacterized membrane protein
LESLFDILRFIGGSLCHQQPGRSFGARGFYMPVCSRCAGIYLGFLLSLVFIVVLERAVKGEFPSVKMTVTAVGVFLVMGGEAALSTFRIIESFAVVRFITGFMTGWFMLYLLFPLKNSVMLKRYRKQCYLDKKGRFTAWIVIAVLLMVLFIFTYQKALLLWSILAIIGMLFFTSFILLILFFSLIRKLTGIASSWRSYILSILAGLMGALGLLSFLSYIRRFLI